jgi:uncharacterized protein (DUF2235 family)
MANRQRLVVCLDGTWNEQDSCTNVLHHFNLVSEGIDPKTNLLQRRYYHRGVGTGVLDRISGGGFGFGLEQNVRDAYNWLVENYCDGPAGADEIYIFGFSRGAYTARSLVGFISEVGLLRRGAPITVDQLWSDYCILGRQKEERRSAWETVFWRPQAHVRPITQLTSDPWSRRPYIAPDLNETERLLIRWSRRVRITYLGVYDTVGAIGWDALAIPGLTSKLAMVNNMRPTTLIQYCRHALAIDENRSSFNHTPFRAFIGHDLPELERGAEQSADAADTSDKNRNYWERTLKMWDRKIEQRWFVGAHSNIGGGYDDNLLSEAPLHWVLDGAALKGLVTDFPPSDGAVTPAEQVPRDSYREFAPPLWVQIIRAKRNYRDIDPPPVSQASRKEPKGSVTPPGFSLQSIHEVLDESVARYWNNPARPVPPHLYQYAERHQIPLTRPVHQWLRNNVADPVFVVLWATLAVAGLLLMDNMTGLMPVSARWWVACAVAVFLPVVDWGESAVHFDWALGSRNPLRRAFLDAIYWLRALAFVLLLFGAAYAVVALPYLGRGKPVQDLIGLARQYGPVPLFAAAATVVLRLRWRAVWASLLGVAAAAGLAAGLAGTGWVVAKLFQLSSAPGSTPLSWGGRSVPGQLLLLQLSLAYVWRALLWVRDPMATANLGSVVPLQWCATPAHVASCLESWRKRLACAWLEADKDTAKGPAAIRLRHLLGQALWRDVVGLIPVYGLVFLLGLWFAASSPVPGFEFLKWPQGFPLWWSLPLAAAVANYLQDICQLLYLKLHRLNRPAPLPMTLFSFAMSRVKDAGVLLAGGLTIGAAVRAIGMMLDDMADWRAKIATVITGTVALAVAGGVVVRLVHFFRVERKQRPAPPPETSAAEA